MKIRAAFAGLVLVSLPLLGQNFISAKAGVVNYEEGRQLSSPRQLHEGEYFSEPNRAELLLTPGSFLRLERNAEIQMLSTRLSGPAFELVNGVASLEVMELPKETKIHVAWGAYEDDRALMVDHKGIYRFEVATDGSALRVMVEKGQLEMLSSNQTLKEGQQADLMAASVGPTSKFDKKLRDDFDLWSAERSEMLGVASYRAAQGVSSFGGTSASGYGMGYSGLGYGGLGYGGLGYGMMGNGYGTMYPGMGMWAFNPFFGYFTYLPYSGLGMSPWGSYFYSPSSWYYYQPPYGANGGSVQTAVGNTPVKPVPSPRFAGANNGASPSSMGRGSSSGTSSTASPSSMGAGSPSAGSMSAGGLGHGGGGGSASSSGGHGH